MPGAMVLTTGQSTAPWAWWVRRLDTEVKQMVAMEVPKARCTTCSGGRFCKRNSTVNAGTSTAPPPTPSNPAKKPAKAPRAR